MSRSNRGDRANGSVGIRAESVKTRNAAVAGRIRMRRLFRIVGEVQDIDLSRNVHRGRYVITSIAIAPAAQFPRGFRIPALVRKGCVGAIAFGHRPTAFGRFPTVFGRLPTLFGQLPTPLGKRPGRPGPCTISIGCRPIAIARLAPSIGRLPNTVVIRTIAMARCPNLIRRDSTFPVNYRLRKCCS